MNAAIQTVAAEFAEPHASVRVRKLRRDDLLAACELAVRAGYRRNDSDVIRFAVAVVAELATSSESDSLQDVLDRVARRSRSVSGRKRQRDDLC